jgi:cation:H+ antiporter
MILAEFIPHAPFEWLEANQPWGLWLVTCAAMVVLLFGADRAVLAAVRLARAARIPTVVIGATIVSLGTTSPEAVVSVMAAFRGDSGLALGNGVGSVICNTALIFGLACLLTRLPKARYVLTRQGWIQFGAGALLVVMVLVGS